MEELRSKLTRDTCFVTMLLSSFVADLFPFISGLLTSDNFCVGRLCYREQPTLDYRYL